MAESPSSPSSRRSVVFLRRSASTVALWSLLVLIFVSKWGWAYLALTGVLGLVATVEYFRMLLRAGAPCFPRWGIGVSVTYGGLLYAFLLRGAEVPAWLDPVAIFVVAAGAFTLQLRHRVNGLGSLAGVALTVLGFVAIPYFFNFIARIIFMDHPGGDTVPGIVSSQGTFLLLWVLAVTKFTDMGAYITGTLIGRHKMIPHISPAKTWEGFGGAVLFAQLAGCGLFALFPGPLAVFGHFGHVVALGLILTLLAVIGDLAESVIKRALDAKDSGRFLPGIGGSLDLIDSVCFTAPAAYFYLKWILPHTS